MIEEAQVLAVTLPIGSVDLQRPQRGRSEADCQSWMRQVGFSTTRVEPLVGPDSMVIGLK
jgi:hypothetical protein